MKLAYKISIPLVLLISALILFVTINAANTQKDIIAKGQQEQAQKVMEQFEKNKNKDLTAQQKEIAFIAGLATEVSANYLYNFDFDALKKPLNKLLSYEEIKAIDVYETNNKEAVVSLGQKHDKYKTIKQDVLWKDSLTLGYVEIFYDDSAIISYFENTAQEIMQQIQQSNDEQNRFIDKTTSNQIILDLSITLLILLVLLLLVYKMVTKPLGVLEHGLEAFFNFLQGKQKSVSTIDIKSSDEFGKMCTSINENIEVSAKLHASIQELNSNLEVKVEQRTKQVKQLLNNASQGFLSFNSDFVVDAEYSKECENIFAKNIAGENIAHLLHIHENEEEYTLFQKMVADIFDPEIPERRKSVLMRLFPQEYIINEKSIKVDYKNLENQNIMMILTDVTENKRLEEKIDLEKKRLKMVVSVVSNLSQFYEVVDEFMHFAKDKMSYLEQKEHYFNMLTLFYRKIHTFKGNFAQKDMVYIVPKLHAFENELNAIVKNPERSFEDFKSLIEDVDLTTWLQEDMEVLNEILDEKLLNNKNSVCVSKPFIEMVENKLKELVEHPKDERNVTYEEILEDVSKIKQRSLIEELSSYEKFIEQLAQRLNKKVYPMQILGDDIYVKESIRPFIKSLVHVFRNSVDHGIESLEDRMESVKDNMASINCLIQKNDAFLTIQVVDDGLGLDIDKIKKKSIELGIYSTEEANSIDNNTLYYLIFSDSFSTKDEVTDLSGRGVGLSAVKYELEQLGGNLEIQTQAGKGTTFSFNIPLQQIV